MAASPPSSWYSRLDQGNSFSDSFRTLLSSLLTYLETRWMLFKVESGQAVRLGLQVTIAALFGLLCAAVMYVCAMVGVTLWIAHQWWDGSVMPAAFIMAGVHLILLAACAAFIAWALHARQLFHDTRTEFKEDKRWLHLQQTTSNG